MAVSYRSERLEIEEDDIGENLEEQVRLPMLHDPTAEPPGPTSTMGRLRVQLAGPWAKYCGANWPLILLFAFVLPMAFSVFMYYFFWPLKGSFVEAVYFLSFAFFNSAAFVYCFRNKRPPPLLASRHGLPMYAMRRFAPVQRPQELVDYSVV